MANHISITDVGKVRSSNQDAVKVSENRIYIVADGVGGQRGGEVASRIAVEGIAEELQGFSPAKLHSGLMAQKISKAVLAVNKKILSQSRTDPAKAGMATTVVVVYRLWRKIVFGWVGDSRLYRYRDGELRQLTRDHTMIQEMVSAGRMSKEEARKHPRKNVINRAVGLTPKLEVDTAGAKIKKGDYYLLCSDGLTDRLDDDKIKAVLSDNSKSVAEKGQLLLQKSLDNGGNDNISIILFPATNLFQQSGLSFLNKIGNIWKIFSRQKPVLKLVIMAMLLAAIAGGIFIKNHVQQAKIEQEQRQEQAKQKKSPCNLKWKSQRSYQ